MSQTALGLAIGFHGSCRQYYYLDTQAYIRTVILISSDGLDWPWNLAAVTGFCLHVDHQPIEAMLPCVPCPACVCYVT